MHLTKTQQEIQNHLQYLCDVCVEVAITNLPDITVKLMGGDAAHANIAKNIIKYPVKWLMECNIVGDGFLVVIAHEVTHFIIRGAGHPHTFRAAESLLLYNFGIRPIYHSNCRYASVYTDLTGQIICGSIGEDISNEIADNKLLLF